MESSSFLEALLRSFGFWEVVVVGMKTWLLVSSYLFLILWDFSFESSWLLLLLLFLLLLALTDFLLRTSSSSSSSSSSEIITV